MAKKTKAPENTPGKPLRQGQTPLVEGEVKKLSSDNNMSVGSSGATQSKEAGDDGGLATSYEFRTWMHQKLVPLEDFDKEEKDLLKFWRKQGLLPFFQRGTWARFSFAQMIWIRMLQDLRGFDYAISKMLRLADYLFKRAYLDNLPEQNLKAQVAALEKKGLAGVLGEKEAQNLQYIKDVLQDKALLDAFKYDVNYLTQLIEYCLVSGEEGGLLLFVDGSISEYKGGGYHFGENPDGEVDPSRPHIYLSIRHYLKEYLKSSELGQVVSSLQLFSEGESKVLRAIKDPRNKEVRVELKKGKVHRVEVVAEDVIITGGEAEVLRKALGLKNYERMVVDTVDEKTLVVRKTIKKL
ncbi:hypothetical protein [Paracnuella aquatica]|uniref:hypothetical protein n=1 Tax=Paracnuella aquatica TaxID=2268757 RepID=UPI000F5137B7|nr:hypothetical protein [Paracnuella aquatica]RPD43645.1 hypothetical protein DRJ53_19530 [Paracnuella aquatica]